MQAKGMPEMPVKKSLTKGEIILVHAHIVRLLDISANYECFGQNAGEAETIFGKLLMLLSDRKPAKRVDKHGTEIKARSNADSPLELLRDAIYMLEHSAKRKEVISVLEDAGSKLRSRTPPEHDMVQIVRNK